MAPSDGWGLGGRAGQVGIRLSQAVEALLDCFLKAPLKSMEQVRKALSQQGDDRRQMRELADKLLVAAELRVSQGAHEDASILRCLVLRRYGLVRPLSRRLCLVLSRVLPCGASSACQARRAAPNGRHSLVGAARLWCGAAPRVGLLC